MTRRRILVTDGTQRSALAVVRSLGRAGHTVFVCGPRVPSLAGSSKHSFAESIVASALDAPAQFVGDVSHLIERWRIDTVIPITEASLLALLPERESLGAMIPWPDLDTFRAVSDKKTMLATAASLGFAIPKQMVLNSDADVRAMDPTLLDYPLVLKPARSVSEHEGQRVSLGVIHVASPSALRRAITALGHAAFPILVQQRIVGPGIGIFLLMWDGKVLATFAHERLREKPPSGGVSVYSQSVAADVELVERSRLLLETMKWRGVAMVEFKRDARTGVAYLMEVNGRFWGSLQLAIDSGVDFPALLIAAASGETIAATSGYRVGTRSRWWWGDVDHLLARWRKDAATLALPAGAPSRWRATLDFLTFWHPHDHNEVFRLKDPRPFLRETIEWLHRR
ncbi:MAG TPA: ATP-grasp domain-containing protein [Gemmatimonadaceae bacterium]|nr:ATP-grasp domain-containing protein [Gemmatimonadaceae bacterium]